MLFPSYYLNRKAHIYIKCIHPVHVVDFKLQAPTEVTPEREQPPCHFSRFPPPFLLLLDAPRAKGLYPGPNIPILVMALGLNINRMYSRALRISYCFGISSERKGNKPRSNGNGGPIQEFRTAWSALYHYQIRIILHTI